MLRFEIRTKRRRYIIYVEFQGEEYEIEIVGVFGRKRNKISAWEQIAIQTDPFMFAKAEIKKFELKEDYIDQYDDRVFYLGEEAEAAAAVEESPHEVHQIMVSDYITGKQEVLVLERTNEE